MFHRKQNPDALQMLLAQCEQTEIAIAQLIEYMGTRDASLAAEIEQTEKAADRKQEILSDYVENTFITPVSRHHLFNLSRVIDDLTDAVLDLKDFIVMFDYEPRQKDIQMARLSQESIHILADALREWDDTDTLAFWQSVKRIRKNEDQMKRLFWENVKEIIQEDSIQTIITAREFCRDLNSLADKIEKVADRLGDLKIKSIK